MVLKLITNKVVYNYMITILGVQFPISDKILYPKKTEVIMSYLNAIKNGKSEAKKILGKV